MSNIKLFQSKHISSTWGAHRMLAFSFVLLLGLFAPVFASDQPSWILSTERKGFVSVVGFAPKQANNNTQSQQRVALMKARQQLGQIVRVRVEHTLRIEQQTKNGEYTQNSEESTRLTSNAALNLNKAEVTAQWVDPTNGDLYLLLELEE